MKLATFASAFVLLFSSIQANAGAYGFSCTNVDGSIKIGKQYASINGTPELEYSSTTLNYPSTSSEKNALKIEVYGKQLELIVENGRNECGDATNRTTFATIVEVRDAKNSKIAEDAVLCVSSFENGHCIGGN